MPEQETTQSIYGVSLARLIAELFVRVEPDRHNALGAALHGLDGVPDHVKRTERHVMPIECIPSKALMDELLGRKRELDDFFAPAWEERVDG